MAEKELFQFLEKAESLDRKETSVGFLASDYDDSLVPKEFKKSIDALMHANKLQQSKSDRAKILLELLLHYLNSPETTFEKIPDGFFKEMVRLCNGDTRLFKFIFDEIEYDKCKGILQQFSDLNVDVESYNKVIQRLCVDNYLLN